MQESHRRGSVAELMIAAKAIELGYRVSLPIGHDSRYDLILDKDNTLIRVQVKTTISTEEFLIVRTHSVGRIDHKHTIKRYTKEDIDAIIIFDERTREFYYLPASMLGDGKTAIQFRLTPSKNNQTKKVRWAKDFIWSSSPKTETNSSTVL